VFNHLRRKCSISPTLLFNLKRRGCSTRATYAHTLFAIEDIYGVQIGEIDGEVCLRLDKFKGITYLSMFDIFSAWYEMSVKLKSGEITKEEYDDWRYNYPNAK